ncbi:hypothetical protein GCM10027055_01080 [Janibacter alkaliphilus]|uniref:Tripartite-type tricarboxylate transporter receptor subunit TctC n=1 Tax=Janibacter alkaliphilus TaxID=1069963 RepID=A0A852X7H1_9MICO|nr:tripartite-type tricarboxylate transporter receptor subunit TctC [Janibacter alkaliphilus]
MPRSITRTAALAAVTALTLSACGGVKTTLPGGGDGQEYPRGTVEMYVGASPGGSSDLISRAVGNGLSESLGGTFAVINREGANGALAAAETAVADADGSTISIQNASLFAITPLAVAEDEVTDIDDFEVVGGISRDDYVMVTNPDSGYTSLDDISSAGSTVTYATTGIGTGAQLSCGLTMKSSGAPAEAVPFDGGAPPSPRSSAARSTPPACRSARPSRTSSPASSPRSRSSAPSASSTCRTCPPPPSRACRSRSTSTAS